jgi:hypothetical protein
MSGITSESAEPDPSFGKALHPAPKNGNLICFSISYRHIVQLIFVNCPIRRL